LSTLVSEAAVARPAGFLSMEKKHFQSFGKISQMGDSRSLTTLPDVLGWSMVEAPDDWGEN
jgi:hypothetical protein